jgi:transmembrane sensor
VADQIDPRLLDRYVTGECSPAERIVVEAWIATDPRRREMVDGLLAFRSRLVQDANTPSVDAMQAALSDRLARERESRETGVLRFRGPAPRVTPPNGLRRWPFRSGWEWSKLAAAIVVVVGAVGIGVRVFNVRSHAPVAYREYVSASGERSSVTLADGTQFTLAPESRLLVPVDFAAGHRAVVLDGEAFFAVVHDAAHPFSVRAGRVVTVDVGTSFDIRAYAGEHGVRIGVSDGEVALTVGGDRPSARRALTAGDLAQVDHGGATTVSRGVDADEFLAWTRGTLVFRRAPLSEVTAELTRWYGVTFTAVDPALADVRLTANYEHESLDDVLDQMGRVIGARVERHGRRIALRAVPAG